MVPHPRTAVGAHGLRPLGLPRYLTVEVDALGVPVAVRRGAQRHAIARIEDSWRIADGWWGDHAIARTYIRVLFDDGRLLTLFHDDEDAPDDGWYEQRY